MYHKVIKVIYISQVYLSNKVLVNFLVSLNVFLQATIIMYIYSTSMTKPYKQFNGQPTKALSMFKLPISTAD